MYDFLVYIGRFQPIHRGHVHVIREALKQTKNLIIIIGSHEKARDIRNPFTTAERYELIKASLTPEEWNRIFVVPQYDYTYNDDRWISSIQASVNAIAFKGFVAGPIKIGIVGYDKDHSTYYLKKFPQWSYIPIEPDPDFKWMNATLFRSDYFSQPYTRWYSDFPENEAVGDFLLKFKNTLSYLKLKNEFQLIKDYKESFKGPFPPTFMTVDAVVRQSGHLLIIERGPGIGEGLWALPGGFLKENLTLEETVIEELYEETGLKVPRPVIKGSIHARRTFDDPYRSNRGRSITEAFDIRLSEAYELPKVKGGDDAKDAFWVPFSEIEKNRVKFFEDHFAIIQNVVGL